MANNNQQQQYFQAPVGALGTYEFNPKSILESEQFPDILNYLNTEQIQTIFNVLAQQPAANSHLTNKKGPLGGYTALHWMAIKNELDLLKFLVVECRADVNSKANLGETPLLICIKNCNLYSIDFLIAHGADVECRDSYNRSVIHWAAYTGKVVLLHYFQKYHAMSNFNDPDQFQQNALHIACGSGFIDMIRFLIDRSSVDLFAKDFNGNTCLHLAAKCGLPRVCWLITQERNGEAAKLILMKNNSDQTPFDFIRNERAPHFRMIKKWLRLEAKTNKWLGGAGTRGLASLFRISTYWNSNLLMKGERVLRFIAFFIVLTVPVVLNTAIIYPNDMSTVKGLIGLSTFVMMAVVIVKQRHRCDHISGLQNPFFLGYFSSLFVHNYFAYYAFVIEEFSIYNLFTIVVVCLSAWHFYAYYRIVTQDPGFCKESVKKKDGTPYELRDLMELNANTQRTYRDSVSLMCEPSSTASMDGGQTNALFMCEHCLLVQSIPTKHCKLCERCCSKFDHHCLYICSCVGLKNHRTFMYFLISSIVCTTIFIYSLYRYFVAYADELDIYNRDKPLGEQIGVVYVVFASGFYNWLAVLFVVNSFSMIMVIFLTLYQFKFISLGFTSQFPPPIGFVKVNKRMSTLLSSLMHRVDNLYTFFFESCESQQELYYRQQSEYRKSTSQAKIIPVGYYPTNNFAMNMPGAEAGAAVPPKPLPPTASNTMSPIDPNYQSSSRALLLNANEQKSLSSSTTSKSGQFEIDLD